MRLGFSCSDFALPDLKLALSLTGILSDLRRLETSLI
jgi:hypothetical protein